MKTALKPGIRATVSQSSLSGQADWLLLTPYPSRGYNYYRLQWGKGCTVLGVCHIPGGNVGRAEAIERASKVASWIKANRSQREILSLIKGWKAEALEARRRCEAEKARVVQLDLFVLP